MATEPVAAEAKHWTVWKTAEFHNLAKLANFFRNRLQVSCEDTFQELDMLLKFEFRFLSQEWNWLAWPLRPENGKCQEAS